jgi:hypothetical protein
LLRPAPGKTHIAIAIARICIRAGFHGRFSDPVDLGNLLEVEGRAGRQGQLADYLSRLTCGLNQTADALGDPGVAPISVVAEPR